MTDRNWSEERLEQHLRALPAGEGLPGQPELTTGLLASVPLKQQRRVWTGGWRIALTALALMLIGLPITIGASGGTFLGTAVRLSELSLEKWREQGFSGWLASPGEPEFLTPEETERVAPFPIRTPAWVPEGFQATELPRGSYGWVHKDGRWQVEAVDHHFFVSQSFVLDRQAEEHTSRIAVMQRLRGEIRGEWVLPPNAEILEVAGHPAFYTPDKQWAVADEKSEQLAARGIRPEVVDHTNDLTLWVEESNGQITEININGHVDRETLIRVADSFFQ